MDAGTTAQAPSALDRFRDAYACCMQAQAANAARGLHLHESQDEPRLGVTIIEVYNDGSVVVNLHAADGTPLTGYSL